MNTIKFLPLLALLLMGFGPLATARERRLNIPMGDRIYSSNIGAYGDTIQIKREILRRYPRLYNQLTRAELEDVRLVAKSAMGFARAYLMIGNWRGAPYRIDGEPGQFFNNDPATYDRIDFRVPRRIRNLGAWMIKINGTIKVKRMVVVIDTALLPIPRPRPIPVPRPIPRPRPRPRP